jgi:hypothetical protein
MPFTTLHRFRTPILLTVCAAAAVIAATPAHAAKKELSTWDKYQLYLKYQNEPTTVTEGEGLKDVKLGMRFAAVLKRLGKPAKQKGFHILGRTRSWVYRLDAHTQLQLTGHNTVETISLRGTPQSPYTTTAGAHFGMPAFQIRTFYGTDTARIARGILDYPFRGIRFIFHSGSLGEITVYPPKKH